MKRGLIAVVLIVAGVSTASAGFNDPWYLAYQVSGGTLTKYLGPYSSKMECQGARYTLPFGAKYIGCYQ